MALAYVAALPLPLLCPQLQLCIGLPSIQFSADLSGALALNADLTLTPPTAALYLSAEIESQFLLEESIVLGLPTIAFDLSVSVSIEASFSLSLSLLPALSIQLAAPLTLYAYTYEGTGNALGAALTSGLASTWPDGSPTSTACNALIFGATSAAAMSALQDFIDGVTYATGLSAGEVIASIALLSPLTAKAEVQASAAIMAKAAAQAQVSASLSAGAAIPTPTATLSALGKYQANLRADLDLAPPAIGVALSATAGLAANIQASAGFMAAFGAVMGVWAGEFFVYTYSGTGAGMGAAVTSALASTWGDGTTPTSGACVATILATTDSFTYGILTSFFGGV
jgi:hypothetical protein